MKKAPACPSCQQPLPPEVRAAGLESVLCPSCGARLKRGPRKTGTISVPAVPPERPSPAPAPAPMLDMTAMAERVENSALLGLGSGDDATRPDAGLMQLLPDQRPPPPAGPAWSPPQAPRTPPAATPTAPSLPPLQQVRPKAAPPAAAAPPAPSLQPQPPVRAPAAPLQAPPTAAPSAPVLQPLAKLRAPAAPPPAPPPEPEPAPDPDPPMGASTLFALPPDSRPPSEISPAPAIEAPVDPLEGEELAGPARSWWRGRAGVGMAALVIGPVLLLLAGKLATGWPEQAGPATAAPAPATAPGASAPHPETPAPVAAASPIGQVRQPLLQPPAEPEPEPAPAPGEAAPPPAEAPPSPAPAPPPPEAPPPALPGEKPIEEPRSPKALAGKAEQRARRHERHRRRTVAAAAAAIPAGAAREAYQRGSALLLAGDSAGAVVAYREAIARDPQEPAGYRGLGLAHAERGERADALRHLRRYLKRAPRAPDRRLIERRIRHLSRKG
jgi:outer membrane biosynthesis protein TonB